MRALPERLLQEHSCSLRPAELLWQQMLRLNQSLWRAERGYPAAQTARGSLGSALESAWAMETGASLMTATARRVARAEIATARRDGKIVRPELMFANLLSSMPLCFKLFAELQADQALAALVIGDMLGKPLRVTKIEFEYSPGRGRREFTRDSSAADVYVEYEVGRGRGFLCIEVKCHEDLIPRR